MDSQLPAQSSLRDFLHVLFKRKGQILIFFIATVCTVALGTFLANPTYEATAKILVKIGRENLYVPTVPNSGNNPVINVNREEQLNSEIEILTSHALLEKVVETLGPALIYSDLGQEGKGLSASVKRWSAGGSEAQPPLQKAVLRFRKDLSVEAVKKSNVIQIGFKHKDPQMAADVTNKLVELFLDHHLEVFKTPQSYRFFQDQSQNLMGKLRQTEGRFEAFKKEHNVSALDQERPLLLTHEAALRTEFNQTLSQIAETQSRLRQLEHQLGVIPKNVPQAEEIEHSPYVINTLQGRLMELQLKEQELLSKYTEESRLVQSVREEIDMVRGRLTEQESKKYGKTRSGLNITFQRVQDDLLKSQADLNALQAKKEAQITHLNEYRQRLDALNRIELTLAEMERQVDVDQQNYKLYLTKFEESRISDAMDTEKIANLTPIQAAQPPVKPISPKKLLNLVLGIFLGAFGGLGLAFFMEYLDDTLERPEDAESTLSLPVLASIPELSRALPQKF